MSAQNIQLLQILFVIAFLALSGLGWVIRKAQEQREKKRILAERQRRLEEMLRTGRDPTTEQATAMAQATGADRARLEELSRRRQAQMEQLRREHAQRRQQEANRGDRREVEVPPIIVMGPNGPVAVPRAGHGQGRAGSPSPRPGQAKPTTARQGRPVRPQGKQQRKQERPQERPKEREEPKPTPALGGAAELPPAAGVPSLEAALAAAASGRRAPRRMVTLPTVNAGQATAATAAQRSAEYRRLVAMMEALRPPLAIREQEEPGPVYRAF